MANTIKIDYKIQARYLQMFAEDLGLVSNRPLKENVRINQDNVEAKELKTKKNKLK